MEITERKRVEENINHRFKIEKAITSVSRLFASQLDVDLNEVLKIIGEVVSVNRTYIFQFRQNGKKMDNTHEWCSSRIKPQVNNLQDLDSALFQSWMKKLHAGESIVINTIPSEAASEEEILKAQYIHSLFVVPIYATNDTLIGFIGFDDTEVCRQWSDEDISLLRVVAEMLANYWERKLAEEKYRQLLEDINDGYAVVQEGKLSLLTRDLVEIFGYEPGQVVGKSLTSSCCLMIARRQWNSMKE